MSYIVYVRHISKNGKGGLADSRYEMESSSKKEQIIRIEKLKPEVVEIIVNGVRVYKK